MSASKLLLLGTVLQLMVKQEPKKLGLSLDRKRGKEVPLLCEKASFCTPRLKEEKCSPRARRRQARKMYTRVEIVCKLLCILQPSQDGGGQARSHDGQCWWVWCIAGRSPELFLSAFLHRFGKMSGRDIFDSCIQLRNIYQCEKT